MACYLVAALGAVAGLFFLAGADFLGAMQLMVYVGGTLVLLVFGVMLTACGPLAALRSSGGQWIMVALVGGSLLAVLLQTVWNIQPGGPAGRAKTDLNASVPPATTQLGMGLLGLRTDRLGTQNPDAGQPASAPGYLLVFEILSVHLVVALVGAAYLARAKRRKGSGGI
jgi:NADH:ubiquinone oxidoreductase subunit 6 (subunit J)